MPQTLKVAPIRPKRQRVEHSWVKGNKGALLTCLDPRWFDHFVEVYPVKQKNRPF